jgi:hypothetical protein
LYDKVVDSLNEAEDGKEAKFGLYDAATTDLNGNQLIRGLIHAEIVGVLLRRCLKLMRACCLFSQSMRRTS